MFMILRWYSYYFMWNHLFAAVTSRSPADTADWCKNNTEHILLEGKVELLILKFHETQYINVSLSSKTLLRTILMFSPHQGKQMEKL